jgi:transcription elongation factor GreA
MVEQVPITKQGADNLQQELQRLKKQDRPAVIQAIAEARAHGDLKENAEYHAAKEQQGFIEGRIRYLEDILSRLHIIDVTQIKNTGRVIFGATIALINDDTGEHVHYQIVGDEEADIKQNKLSVSSPIARALIGKEKGDIVEITIPTGTVVYEVKKVEYI